MKQHLWQIEHPKSEVPEVIFGDSELLDVSWHNDEMPSFEVKGARAALGERDIRLWVDYPDSATETRFIVEYYDWDGRRQDTIYSGNDAQVAISSLKQATREAIEHDKTQS